MGMPAKQKVRAVGQGSAVDYVNDTRFGAVKDAFGVTLVAGTKDRYDAWQIAEKARLAEEKSREDAQNVPDLTSATVQAAIQRGYRDNSIARRSRANSFQTGASGFVNQGLDALTPGGGLLSPGKRSSSEIVTPQNSDIKVNQPLPGMSVKQKAKAGGF